MQIPITSSIPFLLATSTTVEAVGNYLDRCGEVRLDDNGNPQDLTGDCTSDGTGPLTFWERKTRLDLNLCYSVDPASGNMVPKDGGPGLNNTNINFPCANCFNGNGRDLPLNIYVCDCPADPYEGGELKRSMVDMNDFITNVNGYLTCFNHTAVLLSEYLIPF